MKIPSVTGLIDSPAQYFLESSWRGKAVQILCAISFLSLIYYVASRCMKTNQPPPQDPVNLSGRVVAKRETPVEQELSSNMSFPPWLKEINENTWQEKVDIKKYGLDFTGAPRIKRLASAKSLKALSERVQNKMGITNMVIPKNLTLKIVLQIAKDYSVPISPYLSDQIITKFGDIPAVQTRVLFFTNCIFTHTSTHTPDKHGADVTNIGIECGVAIQRPGVRDFMAFLVLTYLNSPEDARTLLYFSTTFTRLLEKVDAWSVYGGFDSSGLIVRIHDFGYGNFGFGASGSSEDIGTRNIGT